MNKTALHISRITTKDIPEVLQILDVQLGNGFMAEADLATYVDHLDCSGWVAKYDHRIVGVTLASVFPISEINQNLYLQPEEVYAVFPTQSQIGMAKLMATLPEYTGRGIGFALMAERMKWFEPNCEAVFSICWEESNGGAAKLLTKYGFQNFKTIQEYWKDESLNTPYNCARCGAPPCLCSGSFYIKYFS